jgi:hypothetical protein
MESEPLGSILMSRGIGRLFRVRWYAQEQGTLAKWRGMPGEDRQQRRYCCRGARHLQQVPDAL